MFWVGVDVAKDFHSAAVRDSLGVQQGDVLDFSNDAAGFASFFQWLFDLDISSLDSLICMEATGHYWRNLAASLASAGFSVSVVDPMQIEAFRKAETVRKVKTDKTDALLIADFARFKNLEANYSCLDTEGLKRLTRYRSHLIHERTQLKNKLSAAIHELFPALPKLLGGISSASFLALVSAYSSPSAILKTDVSVLGELLSVASRGRFGVEKAELLQEFAASNIGPNDDAALAFEVSHLAEMILFYNGKVADLEREISSLVSETDAKLLQSIPGVGVLGAAVILGEISDPTRFKNAKALMAYSGMDATVRQSGKYEGMAAHMSKRGCSYLRYMLMLCADAARRNDPYFGEYYKSLRARNKHHYVAVSACARKLCGVILTVLKEKRPYEHREPIQLKES